MRFARETWSVSFRILLAGAGMAFCRPCSPATYHMPFIDAQLASSAEPQLDQLALTELKDLQAKVKVVKADQMELGKINKDFGMAYRLKDLTFRYKEPNKIRMDGSIGRLIVNGSTRLFQVPAIRLTKKDELGDTPGKQYSLVDVGLLTKSGVAKVQNKFLRAEKLDGAETRVFDVSYRGADKTHYLLWVDTRTHIIVKREWYDNEGKRRATFLYQEPKEVTTGLWVPTRIEIRNSEGAVAAVSDYSDVKVNQGLDDALFNIS